MAYSKIKCPECKKIFEADVSNLFVMCPYCQRKVFENEYGVYSDSDEEEEEIYYDEQDDFSATPVTLTDVLSSEGLVDDYNDSDEDTVITQRKDLFTPKNIVIFIIFILILGVVVSMFRKGADKDVIIQTGKNTAPITYVTGTEIVTEKITESTTKEDDDSWLTEVSGVYVERNSTEQIKNGMRYIEVIDVLGKDYEASKDDDGNDVLTWPLQPYKSGGMNIIPEFAVTFDEYGKVTSYEMKTAEIEETTAAPRETTTSVVKLADIQAVDYYRAVSGLKYGQTYEEIVEILGKQGTKTNAKYEGEEVCDVIYVWNLEKYESEGSMYTGEIRAGIKDGTAEKILIKSHRIEE